MSENSKPDIVERLREVSAFVQKERGRVAAAACISEEAADEIERLRAVVARKYVTIDFSNGFDSSFFVPSEFYPGAPQPPASPSMTRTPEQEALREMVARAMWESECDVAPQFRDSIWDRSRKHWDDILPDETRFWVCDSGGCQRKGNKGRKEYFALADAAIAVVLKEASRVAEGNGLRQYSGQPVYLEIAAAILSLIPQEEGTP